MPVEFAYMGSGTKMQFVYLHFTRVDSPHKLTGGEHYDSSRKVQTDRRYQVHYLPALLKLRGR